ncbi:amino acid ABC transporter permease [Ensifer aridi]|uniref:amino acid ABC transporter permease n=1 Tax=Ensifer aridi TaxID=1708715 RepID=UPI0004795631|nr:amino acid ABC transporter permease [Ensifer aridi]
MLDFSFLQSSYLLLLDAATNTLLYSLAALALGFPAALLVCLAILSRNPVLRWLGRFYVSFFRGVPLLVLLLIAFYGTGAIGFNATAAQAAIAALAICEAAYLAECMRGGFLAVPPGQIEAAQISGLTNMQTLRHVILPTVIRLTLPSVVNEATMAVKASSLISVVGILEITRVSQNLASATFQPLEVYLTAGAFYMAINIIVVALGTVVERKSNAGAR